MTAATAQTILDSAARQLDDEHLGQVAELLVTAGIFQTAEDAYGAALDVLAASLVIATNQH